MYFTLVLFSVGAILICYLPILPAQADSFLFGVSGLLALARPATRPIAGLCIGLLYGAYIAHAWQEQLVPKILEGVPLTINGQVSNLPVERSRGWRFQVMVLEGPLIGRKISLAWYEKEPPRAGDVWRLDVRLNRPRGMVNVGLFDYEGWMLSQSIHGTGYVLNNRNNQRISQSSILNRYQGLRQEISRAADKFVAESPARGMVLALLVGDSSQLSPQVWQTLAATGTNHLMIVSGLHVSLVTAMLFWLARRFTTRSIAVALALFGALCYGLLTGFGLPVQRALAMSSIGLLVLTGQREPSVWRALILALAGVLAVNPFSPLAAGFWLSFSAVAGLLAGFAGTSWLRQSKIYALVKTQWFALVATFPMLLCWVFQVSFISVLANFFAVPFVTILIVPLMLLITVLLMLGSSPLIDLLSMELLGVVATCLEQLLRFLEVLAELDWVLYKPASLGWPLALAILGSLTLLLPIRSAPRWIGLIFYLPLLTLAEVSRKGEAFRVDILDVGQGLSVIVSTGEFTILYDAGPAAGRFDAGAQVVLPALRRLGASRIDLFVVSHGDNDHAGGAESIRQRLPVLETVSEQQGLDCRRPRKWHFSSTTGGNLTVKLFTPGAAHHLENRNNLSCVLLIESPFARVLLPGDIEAAAEFSLVTGGIGPVDLLVSPHHGSASSSTPMFINRVNPAWVVHSAGYMNRFGHPNNVILNRYDNRGIRQY
ncbi:MAG: competence protein ComEC, partial [Dinoroseobacter sp.]